MIRVGDYPYLVVQTGINTSRVATVQDLRVAGFEPKSTEDSPSPAASGEPIGWTGRADAGLMKDFGRATITVEPQRSERAPVALYLHPDPRVAALESELALTRAQQADVRAAMTAEIDAANKRAEASRWEAERASRLDRECTERSKQHALDVQEIARLKSDLASRPVAVPGEYLAVVDAAKVWAESFGPSHHNNPRVQALLTAVHALPSAQTRVVQGWADPAYSGGEMITVSLSEATKLSHYVPVTLCYSDPGKEP